MYDKYRLKCGIARVPILAIGIIAALLTACGGGGGGGSGGGGSSGGGGGGGASTPTSITLDSPGTTVNRTVTLTAAPVAATGATVKQVSFMVDGTSIGMAAASPFTAQWDTSTVTDGAHSLTASATDSTGNTVTSAAVSVNVLNTIKMNFELSAAQISFPPPNSTAFGAAAITVDLATGVVTGKIQFAGVTTTGVTINQGFAGTTGASVLTLTQDATIANQFDVPAATTFTPDQVTTLLQGQLYAIAASAAFPQGEVRGQLPPPNIAVLGTTLVGSQEVPPLTGNAGGEGFAFTTIDNAANTVTSVVIPIGLNNITDVEIDTGALGATGPKLVALTYDTATARFTVTLAPVAASDIVNFKNGLWYINVINAEFPTGAFRGQVVIPPPPTTPTLTELQVGIFTPYCTSCHTGVGTGLPGALNLTAGGPFNAMVGKPTVEQPNLDFVTPGDPTDSYLVQKLLGSPGISGGRMPLNGPYLSDDQINAVEAWISAGALNN